MQEQFQYYKKKVRYIGYIGGGGTGTELSQRKKYLVYGGHHFSCRLKVKNGVGKLDTSLGIYLNDVPYYHEKAIIKHSDILPHLERWELPNLGKFGSRSITLLC